ncbi:MAG: hypothetical protein Q7V88_02445 [Actinomycetota bacterium]|nr:hypothetical protein [Actinomycetota bacterium]
MSWWSRLRRRSPAAVTAEVQVPGRAVATAIRSVPVPDGVVNVGIGFEGELVVSTTTAEPETSFAGRDIAASGASFPHSTTPEVYTIEVAQLFPDGGERRSIIQRVPVAHPHVQPMPDGGFLVVGSRAAVADGVAEHNAVITDAAGHIVHSFCIGDGVSRVQVTPSGRIWVGYFDEGVFGNYGWGEPGGPAPLGGAGLVCWSAAGRQLYEFRHPPGIGAIHDCYAMSAAGETVWTCYYSSFPVCRVGGNLEVAGWTNATTGASQIAAHDGRVVLIGGYQGAGRRLTVGHLGASSIERVAELHLSLPGDREVPKGSVVIARGRYVHVLAGDTWHRLDLADLPS